MNKNTKASRTAGDEGPGSVKAGKYLTFLLGSEAYGIDIMKVQEIGRVKKMPKSPPDMRSDCRKAFSMIGDRMKAKAKGAPSYLNFRIR